MAVAAASAGPSGQSRAGAAPSFADAYDAWDRGDYAVAVSALKRIAAGADTARLEEIALLTGELYQTSEITADGRNASFAGTTGLVIYETGPADSPVVRVADGTAASKSVTEFAGRSPVADPAGRNLAYLGVDGRLRWRAISGGAETAVSPEGLAIASHAWSADGRTIFFAGSTPPEQQHEIRAYGLDAGATRTLVRTDGRANGLRAVPGGATLLYTVTPPPGTPERRPPVYGRIALPSGEPRIIEGAVTPPAFSADGSTLAYVARDGRTSQLMIQSGHETARVILGTYDRLDAPSLSADGARVTFQRMPREDWEVFVADRDGKSIERVTREIQHDSLPRFMGSSRVLAVMGEPRHRRSYLYDLDTGARQRLFHNNTLRTIAPEYTWEVSADGARVLIAADRDGDTVSPRRGVYVVNVSQRVSREDVIARLDAMLAAERSLRAFAARVTKPLAPAIRAIVDRASVTRVFGYEKALFEFDSKHITQPGNAKASAYLHQKYSSFGYTPEYQWFAPRNAAGGRTANVVATLRGTVHPDVIYVVSSHYDSVAIGPGADDDTSGTAALLETARILAGHPQPATIVFASFTGEEAGLLGSREFVRRTSEAKWNVAGALNNDMIGWANDNRLDNTIRYSNPGIRDVQHAVAMTFTDLITYDALYYRSTDAAAFYEAWGDIVGGIGSYPVLGNPHYHQTHDVLETVNHQLVTEVAKTTAATLVMLSNTPARLRGLTAERTASGVSLAWEPSPERDIARYVVTWQRAGAAQRLVVTSPRAVITGAPAGTEVRVIAVNARGLEGWDHARIVVP